MSYKVYDAYRLKGSYDIWETMKSIHQQGVGSVRTILRGYYEQLIKDNPDQDIWKLHDVLVQCINDQDKIHYKNLFDLTIGVSVWKHKGRYYLIASTDTLSITADAMDFLKDRDDLVDYHYQNHTDKPDEISEEDWEERYQIWSEVLDTPPLTLEICSPLSFYKIDPFIDVAMKKNQT